MSNHLTNDIVKPPVSSSQNIQFVADVAANIQALVLVTVRHNAVANRALSSGKSSLTLVDPERAFAS